MMSENKFRVGIFRSNRLDYSTDWISSENYWEKEALRSLSKLLGYDDNLLRSVVKPGDRVVIKPNWVTDKHPYGYDIFSTITHPAVLRAVVELAYEALNGKGEVIIADAPQWDCDFENLLSTNQIQRICDYFLKKFHFQVLIRDLRQVCCLSPKDYIKSSDRIQLQGDPEGYATVNLGSGSAFLGMPHVECLYGADYDRQETIQHHNAERHEYLVSKTILGADVIIHVPKYKVHKKVGTTLNAKGMVGIIGNKNWIAHFRIGPPSLGGDEFPDDEPTEAKVRTALIRYLIDHLLAPQSRIKESLFNLIYGFYKRIKPLIKPLTENKLSVVRGDWYGNDTAWRMTADLARIVLYADREGRIQNTPQRRFFSIVDGIVGGEKEGPLSPTPKPCGILVAGDNLLAVDLVGTRLMGFDWGKVKYLKWLVENSPQPMGVQYPEMEIEIRSNISQWCALMRDPDISDFHFEPHPGWKGHIEIKKHAGLIETTSLMRGCEKVDN